LAVRVDAKHRTAPVDRRATPLALARLLDSFVGFHKRDCVVAGDAATIKDIPALPDSVFLMFCLSPRP
jgi:hypothetical protein